MVKNMNDNISTDFLKKTFLQHVLGPRGGLFAMGCLLGAFSMHIYVMEFVVADLKQRVATLEASNAQFLMDLQEIAFEKLENR